MKQTLLKKFKQILPELYKEANINISPNASPYCPNWGAKYPEESKRGILFVGRATNGWNNGDIKDLDTFFDSPKFLGYTDRMRDDHTGKSGKFNPNRSAYRRTIKRIGERFYGKEWYDYIAYTNLYKFAPNEGGNPDKALKKQQLHACQKILSQEIEVLDPKLVIFFTRDWEKAFLPYLSDGKDWGKPLDSVKTNDGKVKIDIYEINGRFFIITSHPQGKKEENLFQKIDELIRTYLPLDGNI